MFDAFKALVAQLTGESRTVHFGPQDLRVAAAALLAHVVDIDGERSPQEAARLLALLEERFQLDPASARALVDVAMKRDREKVDFDEFTLTLTRALDEPGRREIIAMMWDLARADGVVTEFEESAIWRVARLLGVLDPREFAREAGRDPVAD